jgi:hypothetical protein
MRNLVLRDGNKAPWIRLTDRFVQLIINGTYGAETVGATVAEFAVL